MLESRLRPWYVYEENRKPKKERTGSMNSEKERRDSALMAIPTPTARGEWLTITTAYKAANGDYETWDEWCNKGEGYNRENNRKTWDSIKKDGGITAATLYAEAKKHNWNYTPARVIRRDPPRSAALTATQKKNIADYISTTAQHRATILGYCQGRGITEETIDRFNLGYDPKEKRLVIPYPGTDYYVTRSINIPADGKSAEGDQKYKYPKKDEAGKKRAFNSPALVSGNRFVFITEGQIDAITLEQYHAAAIGSNETSELLKAIQEAGDKLTASVFIIVPDRDESNTGSIKAEEKRQALNTAGYTAIIYDLPESFHDVNETATTNKDILVSWINSAESNFIAEYKRNSGAGRLTELQREIQRSRTLEAIPTGYPTLDLKLGDSGIPGGLYPGLYFIGAISSLGKTTFIVQMADQIAEAGHDVLFFTLEMKATEITAKSISRLTLTTAATDADRKTTRGILSGARYNRYKDSEKNTIRKAIEKYRTFADRLYFIESIGDTGTAEIRAAVKKHKDLTGNTPVVFIDYLQILKPEDARATEKQNTDRAVIELKRISRDFDTPVIAISSFNRENYTSEVSEVSFKESGAIEYSSDVLIGLQFVNDDAKAICSNGMTADVKKKSIQEAKAQEQRQIELKIIKNRNGQIASHIPFTFNAQFNCFIDKQGGHEYSKADAQYGNITHKHTKTRK